MDAAWWKSLLVSTCNVRSFYGGETPPTELGQSTIAHRHALVNAYLDDLLGRRLFQLLLRELESEDTRARRNNELRTLLEHASNVIVRAEGGLYGNLIVHRLVDLPTFVRPSNQMVSHPFHAGAEAGQGSRVLMVTRPGYSCINMQSLTSWKEMGPWQINPAAVLVAPKSARAHARWLANTQYDHADPPASSAPDVPDDDADIPYEAPKLQKTFWRQ